jgi:predicted small metal-binding protein
MEFTLKQLSWIVIGSLGLGGSGYMTMNSKIDELDKKTAVIHANSEHQSKTLDRIEKKLTETKP